MGNDISIITKWVHSEKKYVVIKSFRWIQLSCVVTMEENRHEIVEMSKNLFEFKVQLPYI